jgi:hypothetical protein
MQRKERRLFDRDGAAVAVAQYTSGVLDGYARVYSAFRSVIQEASFREGELHGPFRACELNPSDTDTGVCGIYCTHTSAGDASTDR